MFNQLLSIIIICLMSLFFLAGCSSSGQLEDPGFRQRATAATDAVPIPVEIAKDIERITEEGLLIYSDTPAYSGAIRTLQSHIDTDSRFETENGETRFLSEDARQSYEAARQSYELAKRNYDLAKKITGLEAKPERISTSNKFVAGADQNAVLTEDEMILKSEGPLGKSLVRKKQGPLSFRSGINGVASGSNNDVKTVSYIVRLGDTLMKIAFEKYANYLKWKDIYKVNKNKIKKPELMQVGTELTIRNVKYIYIKRDGKPYLIKKMDTLKSISQKLYGTPDRWKDIWKNNPQLVKNPKKIYAGFTLYYPIKATFENPELRLPSSDPKPKLPNRIE